jgi:hypothetical protein
MAEALQLLAFLWGEPLPDASSPPSEPTPTQHLDTYQVKGAHEIIRHWLEGAHVAYWPAKDRPSRRRSRVGYVDLTPAWLPKELRVVKAVCKEATPLLFGDSPLAAHLPATLRLHPIP